MEQSVLLIVICIGSTNHNIASLYDLEIFRQNGYFQHDAFEKIVRDLDVQYQRLLENMLHKYCAVLADKTCQGEVESL